MIPMDLWSWTNDAAAVVSRVNRHGMRQMGYTQAAMRGFRSIILLLMGA